MDERRCEDVPVGEAERSGRSGLFSEPNREGEVRSSQNMREERCCCSGDESKGDESLLATIFWRRMSAKGDWRAMQRRLAFVAWL